MSTNENRILAIDIGSGTQDILVWKSGVAVENCPKMILPSPTTIVARVVRQATKERNHIFLKGNTMGGGPCAAAVRDHLKTGLKVFALKKAALTFNDDLGKVANMGIELVSCRPHVEPLVELEMGDIRIDAIRRILETFHISIPETLVVAVQDHGFSPKTSNRLTRFEMWKKVLQSSDGLHRLLFSTPPSRMTRMKAIKEAAPEAWVMDTGAAAIIGALLDPWLAKKKDEGVVVVNAGNEHVLAALVKGSRVYGIYEHHTSLMTPEKLRDHLDRFRRGKLANEEVFEDMGHGCFVHPEGPKTSTFSYLGLTGPNRASYEVLGGHMAAPFGDMMLTGCFGLIDAFARLKKDEENGRYQKTN